MAWLLALLLLCWCAGPADAALRTFGSTPDQLQPNPRVTKTCVDGKPTTILNHTLSQQPGFGVVDHFWTVQQTDVELATMGVRTEFSYFFDGETVPSVVFEPAMAAGQSWAAAELGGKWVDSQREVGDDGIFAAGAKMGKSATKGGWWHKIKMPFQSSVLVTARLVPRGNIPNISGKCFKVPRTPYAIIRGYEDTAPTAALMLPSGVTLPRAAKMRLHRLDDVAVEAYDFAQLAKIPAGVEGLLYMTAIGLEVSPPWSVMVDGKFHTTNEYIEGCWHLLRTASEKLPGLPVGDGFEDFFDSAWGFSIIGPDPKNFSDPDYSDSPGSDVIQRTCNGTVNPVKQPQGVCETQGSLFNHPTSGILHFSSDSSAQAVANAALNKSALGVERLSAYRFLDQEVLSFEDGGALLWRNSDNNPKCHAIWDNPRGASHRSMVRSYTWVYEWPKSPFVI